MKTLFVLNDPPYGTERRSNALRRTTALAHREGGDVRIFPLVDAASCAKAGQTVPQGGFNRERMIRSSRLRNASVGVCGTCMDARGLEDEERVEGATRSTLAEMATWTQWSERVLVF